MGKNKNMLLTNRKYYNKKIRKENGIFLLRSDKSYQEQRPFHLYYTLIEKGCHDRETMTTNSKTPIAGTTESRHQVEEC